ncbi:hypothetical protein BDV27DRAFT_164462 [Aspergillus caelatus]|uniref:MalT-like TPR region domain-containing protein n=1 Tax=Aspergillus caelatus TaxID=61420 RepID=A0A5N6ZIN9_9EURO|nr:uncharacterized protein BDV27DRAFT_164462 [Aspergillus caelatus]KAE8357502.1 hypothetical protein BDV27DRAFT_164462 [Aspergillus caelatus]
MLSDVQGFLQWNHCFVWLECYSHFAARAPGEYGHHFQVQSTLRQWNNSFEDLPSDMEKAVNECILQATEDGVSLVKNRFGYHNLRTLSMMRRLSTLYYFSDRFLKAREIRSAVLDGYKIKLGLSDSTTRRDFTDLGYVMYMLDNYVGVEENFYKALGGRDPSSWKMGPLEAETMRELATVYWLKNELLEARNMMETSLSGLIAHFTERHRLTVLCRQYLSHIYEVTGDLEKALKVALGNRAISIAIQGDDHLNTLRGDLFIARLKMSAGQLEDAEDLLTSVFYRQIRVLGGRNSEMLITRATLGIVLARKGDNKAAEAAFREALVGTEEIFGAEHSSTKTIAAWLADFLSTNGQQRRFISSHTYGDSSPRDRFPSLAKIYGFVHLRLTISSLLMLRYALVTVFNFCISNISGIFQAGKIPRNGYFEKYSKLNLLWSGFAILLDKSIQSSWTCVCRPPQQAYLERMVLLTCIAVMIIAVIIAGQFLPWI